MAHLRAVVQSMEWTCLEGVQLFYNMALAILSAPESRGVIKSALRDAELLRENSLLCQRISPGYTPYMPCNLNVSRRILSTTNMRSFAMAGIHEGFGYGCCGKHLHS